MPHSLYKKSVQAIDSHNLFHQLLRVINNYHDAYKELTNLNIKERWWQSYTKDYKRITIKCTN